MPTKKNYNQGHRERLRQRFLREGLEHMPPHNILELLLLYSIPRKDTNKIAHMLIEQFGSLQNVRKASMESLQTVPGIGANTALMLNILEEVGQLYEESWFRAPPESDSGKAVTDYLTTYFQKNESQHFVVLYVTETGYPLKIRPVAKAELSEPKQLARKLYREATPFYTSFLILAEHRQDNLLLPTRHATQMAQEMTDLLVSTGLTVLDYYISGKGGCRSLKSLGLIRHRRNTTP